MRCAAAALALLVAACGGSGGGGGGSTTPPPPATASWTDPVVYSTAAEASLPTAAEITTVTRQSMVLGGVPLNYTVTAGHMTALALTTQAPRASFFYVAYTLDGAAPATRPVTFFYNGGPGSASVWLHLGSFGPRRLDARAPLHNGPTPFPLVENAESLLDVTDLVFVDAVGSGYSQAIAPNTNRAFWSVGSDAEVFRDFVMRYVTVNQRDSSPRFLFGESYGTTRTAVLARLLERAGVGLRGIVLLSSVLDYSNNCGVMVPITTSCQGYVPSFAATGAWFQRATPQPAGSALDEFLARARRFATQRYDPAVRRFLASPPEAPDPEVVAEAAALTGLAVTSWQVQFNMPPGTYRIQLLPGTLLGRYDTRVTEVGGGAASNDPSSSAIVGSFVSAIGAYLGGTLRYTTPSAYVTLSNAIQVWDFSHDGRAVPDTVPDLATALTLNPTLQVLVASGHYDVATPFFTTEQDLARLGTRANVQVRNYAGGHMMYLDDAARVRQKADLADFYRRALR